MKIVDTLILALIQGLTEFLPVSSSGHLVIGRELLGMESGDILLEVFLHFGTFMSVLVIFRRDIRDILKSFFRHLFHVKDWVRAYRTDSEFRFSLFLLVSMLPAGFAGIYFKDFFEALFTNVAAVGAALVFTGFVLLGTAFVRNREGELNLWKSILIGFAQALAIIPGISRSGSTISTALYLGVSAEKAAKFSFIMALPLVFGATVLEAKDANWASVDILSLSLGTVFAFLVGLAAIRWLLNLVVKGRFHHFGWYCLLVGAVTIGVALV